MKKHIFFIIFTLLLLANVRTVHAQDVLETSAGQLIVHAEKTADTRADTLFAFLSEYNSPLAAFSDQFISYADTYNLDWKLVAAIAGVESTFGKHVPIGSYNAWGWGIFTGEQSGIGFEDWEDGIKTVSQGLRKNYVDKGATTVTEMGYIYAASPVWAQHVQYFLDKIGNFQPHT